MGPIRCGGIFLLSEEFDQLLIELALGLEFQVEVPDLRNLSVVDGDRIQDDWLDVLLLIK